MLIPCVLQNALYLWTFFNCVCSGSFTWLSRYLITRSLIAAHLRTGWLWAVSRARVTKNLFLPKLFCRHTIPCQLVQSILKPEFCTSRILLEDIYIYISFSLWLLWCRGAEEEHSRVYMAVCRGSRLQPGEEAVHGAKSRSERLCERQQGQTCCGWSTKQ